MEKRITYYKYKNRFSQYPTVPGSYRKSDKTIIVIFPPKSQIRATPRV